MADVLNRARGEVVEHMDVVASTQQLVAQVRADEPGTPCNQAPHGGESNRGLADSLPCQPSNGHASLDHVSTWPVRTQLAQSRSARATLVEMLGARMPGLQRIGPRTRGMRRVLLAIVP